jgi:hypothetical protein
MILLQRSLGEFILLTQKSTRSGSLFLSDGQYGGSPIDWYFKLFLSVVLSSSRPLNVMSLDPQSVCVMVSFSLPGLLPLLLIINEYNSLLSYL